MKSALVRLSASARFALHRLALAALLSTPWACASEPEGIAKAQDAATTVVLDFEARPLPNMPLPNDLATRLTRAAAPVGASTPA